MLINILLSKDEELWRLKTLSWDLTCASWGKNSCLISCSLEKNGLYPGAFTLRPIALKCNKLDWIVPLFPPNRKSVFLCSLFPNIVFVPMFSSKFDICSDVLVK